MRFFLLLALGVAANAQAEIYKCVEEGGRITYSNAQSKDCTRLNVGPPNSVPSAKGAAGNARTATPSGFPRVDPNTQRARDDERRRILDLELTNEQNGLEEARKALAEQEALVLPEERNVGGRGINGDKVEQRVRPFRDKVALHERNIEALRKEIGNLR